MSRSRQGSQGSQGSWDPGSCQIISFTSQGRCCCSAQVGAQPNTFGIPGVDKYGRLGDSTMMCLSVPLSLHRRGK